MSTLFMTGAAIVLAIAPGVILSLFTCDIELIKVSIPAMYILCFFQIFDGLQVSLAGIFKGLKQTNVVMISNFVGYWLIAIPLGCLLALHYNMNLQGFWYGLIASAVILCTIMFMVLMYKFKKMED